MERGNGRGEVRGRGGWKGETGGGRCKGEGLMERGNGRGGGVRGRG